MLLMIPVRPLFVASALALTVCASAPSASPLFRTRTGNAPVVSGPAAVLQESQASTTPSAVEGAAIDGVYNVHRVGSLWLAGQPSSEGLGGVAQAGIQVVIDLRKPGEVSEFDEPARVGELGMSYVNAGFGGPDELTPQVLDQVRGLLSEHRSDSTLLHCGSANRVGAVWLAARTLDEGVAWGTALSEAREVGLRSNGYVSRVRDYVRRIQRPKWAKQLDEIRAQFAGVRQLSADDLAIELKGETPPLLLDVRTPEEYAVSHLPGAELASDLTRALELLGDSAKERGIVAYCSIGHRSSKLAQELGERGFTNVSNLEGSIFEWANEGHEVQRDGAPVREVHPYNDRWGRFLDPHLWASHPGERAERERAAAQAREPQPAEQ